MHGKTVIVSNRYSTFVWLMGLEDASCNERSFYNERELLKCFNSQEFSASPMGPLLLLNVNRKHCGHKTQLQDNGKTLKGKLKAEVSTRINAVFHFIVKILVNLTKCKNPTQC